MTHDTIPPFALPAVRGRKITADFDGGRLTSNGGVLLPAMAERRLGIAPRLTRLVPDRRDPAPVTHTLADMIRARIFAISMGYEDTDDLDHRRAHPGGGARPFRRRRRDGGPICDIADLVEHPTVIEREVLTAYPDPEIGSMPMHHVSPRLDGTPGAVHAPAPALGEHTAEVLATIGLGPEAVAGLRERGSV